jgi:tetratricopeptide (TPR) repeat protein
MKDDTKGTPGCAADWLDQGNAHMERGRLSRARRAYQTASRLAGTAGDGYLCALALINLASACSQEGLMEEARRHLETALPVAQNLDKTATRSWVVVATIQHRLAEISHLEGKLDEAHRQIDQALAIRLQLLQQFGIERLSDVAASTAMLACINESQGRLDDAHDYFDRAARSRRMLVALHPELHSIELVATLHKLAGVCAKLGKDEDARRYTDEAQALQQKASQGHAAPTVH